MNIYALSSGPGISGVAVIRISGSETKNIITAPMNEKIEDKKNVNLTLILSAIIPPGIPAT